MVSEIYTLQNNTFRRLLFDRVGALLDVHHIGIEHTYPWLIRFTDNVPRDAPSQVPLYRHIMEEMGKRDLEMDEIIRWHYTTRPVSRPMIVDLEAVVIPEKAPVSQSKQSTGTTKESDNGDETKCTISDESRRYYVTSTSGS